MRALRAARCPAPPVTIVVTKGSDGRFTYCPDVAVAILKPAFLPGEFDTVERALEAVRQDDTIPTGARVVVDPAAMVTA